MSEKFPKQYLLGLVILSTFIAWNFLLYKLKTMTVLILQSSSIVFGTYNMKDS